MVKVIVDNQYEVVHSRAKLRRCDLMYIH
nr:hypothetical protein [Pseudoalteromonas sp. BSi20652]